VPLFVNLYEYTDDPQAQGAVRPRHRAFLRGLGGALALSGPTDGNGAVMVFEAGSADEVTELLDDDPFVLEGVVASRRVVGWTPVLGAWLEKLE
jgi:uncharacterized protein YciI